MQGTEALNKQEQLIAAALKTAFIVTLGGSKGTQQQWGCCLGVLANAELSSIRSALGNALAQASEQRGLRAIGVVAYHEVRVQQRLALQCISSLQGWTFAALPQVPHVFAMLLLYM